MKTGNTSIHLMELVSDERTYFCVFSDAYYETSDGSVFWEKQGSSIAPTFRNMEHLPTGIFLPDFEKYKCSGNRLQVTPFPNCLCRNAGQSVKILTPLFSFLQWLLCMLIHPFPHKDAQIIGFFVIDTVGVNELIAVTRQGSEGIAAMSISVEQYKFRRI